MVDWDLASAAYNALPTPPILLDGTENHWRIIVHRTTPGRGQVHFTQPSAPPAPLPDIPDCQLPEDGSIGLARVVAVRLLFHFLLPGATTAPCPLAASAPVRRGTFAPRVLEAPTLAFGGLVRGVFQEVGISVTRVVTLDDAVAALAAREAEAGSGASVNAEGQPGSAHRRADALLESVVTDYPPATGAGFSAVAGSPVGAGSTPGTTQMNMQLINVPLVAMDDPPTAVSAMLAYSFRAPTLPAAAKQEITELFRLPPTDPKFVEKLLQDDPTAIGMFQKLVDHSDVLGQMFANEKIRKGCEMILGAKKEGFMDVTWHVGGFPAMLMLFQPTKPESRRLLLRNRPLDRTPGTAEPSKVGSGDRPESHEEEVGEVVLENQDTIPGASSMPPPDRPSAGKGKGKLKGPSPTSEATETQTLAGDEHHQPDTVSKCSVCARNTPPEALARYICRYCRNVWYCSTVCLNFEITAHPSVCPGTMRPPGLKRKKREPRKSDPKGEAPPAEKSKGKELVTGGPSEKPSRFKCQLARKSQMARVCSGCDKQESAMNGPLELCSICERVYYCSAPCQRRHWKEHRNRCRATKRKFAYLWTYCCDGVHAANKYYREQAPKDPKARALAKKLPGLTNFGRVHPRFARCTTFMPPLWKLVGYGLDKPREFELFFGPTWQSLSAMHREARLFLLFRLQCHKMANEGRVDPDSAWKTLKIRSADLGERKELREMQEIREQLPLYVYEEGSELRYLVDDVQEIIMPYREDWPCSIQWFLSATQIYELEWASETTEPATSQTGG